MTRTKQSTLLDLADSDSDDGFNSQNSALKTIDNMAAAKKPRGRPAANKVTKPESKTTTGRVGAKATAALEKEAERLALAEKAYNEAPKAKRGRKPKKAVEEEADDALATPPHSDEPAKTRGGRGRPKKGSAVPESVQKPTTAKRGRKPAAAKVDEQPPSSPAEDEPSEIPETQAYDGMDVDAAEEQDQVEDLPTFSRYSAPPSAQRISSYRVPFSASKRSASSSLLDSDPSANRRLNEMTKKYEALERKYRDLRNVAVVEAEKNFDRLKKQTEEKTQSSNELIASLKSDLTAHKQLAKEGKKTQQQLEASEAKIDSLQAHVTEITTSLAEAKTEIKSLTMKLNAARAAEATATAQVQVATARVPGSAMKPSAMGARGLDQAQVQATQTGKMKENLYSDLTGLVVTGVKRDGPEDVYDCIQTGRNGTLHFKLAIANENSDENMDEAEFQYKPQLDEHRDRELIELLPEFLADEISFPRAHAAKFYSRVLKSLTEKVE
ncbi:hypothetical protein VMCG_02416 [Cytospora schulzeri]|uniref:Monopolin complex subunit Csm1/Pcs1 C-terminal domain-containing protein n=1 Tax=Cytospora schulzeri TaxID=448051 RepID=A0A423X1K6_9PEZI|nr:hypothetical protein VMCG_02416 [Valsa malicola]